MQTTSSADGLAQVHAAMAAGVRGNAEISAMTGIPYNSVATNKSWLRKGYGDLYVARVLRNGYHRTETQRRRAKEAGKG
ncbi:MAG: hypothetical protein VX529_09590 [Pseudomonadota bacterium]|nr:hypothetical protein [Pseudomonadota bacterium]